MQMKAVVFDMDGVLIDSEPLWREVEVEVLGALGVPITEPDCAATQGLRIDEAVQWWHARHPFEESIEVVAAAIVHGVAEGIRKQGEPLPGALEAIRAVRDVPHAIATSSPWPIIEAVVERLGLNVAIVCSAEDESAGKPDPAVYLTAARRLGVRPEDCIAVEDSRAGVKSAKAAGMRVVAVEPVPEADHQMRMTEVQAFLNREFAHTKL